MEIDVIGGLMSSTVLSLVYVPVVYDFLDDLQRVLVKLLPEQNLVTNASKQTMLT
ncbi:MAG: hypothetical protein JNK47_04930 [Mesorhizobium sp.]|nr:hypothetical protein [Mesorhizobium sp.]MBL8576548.1 hypothetical protein [Mesorhizobium sp.]